MSTRGVIAYATGDTWAGVYQHFDSYPTGLGAKLWHTLHHGFSGDVERLIQTMVIAHPAGWSQWGKRCYCHEGNPYGARNTRQGETYTAEDARWGNTAVFIEWVYVFSRKTPWLTVFAHHATADVYSAPNGRTEPQYVWLPMAQVDLHGSSPDWAAIEAHAEGGHTTLLRQTQRD